MGVVAGTCSAELKLRQKDRDEPNLKLLRHKKIHEKVCKNIF